MTLKEDIRDWVTRGNSENATHMLVVCDMFDYDDYPVFAKSKEDAELKYEQYEDTENLSKVMEVYNLSMDIEDQLNEHRSFNF